MSNDELDRIIAGVRADELMRFRMMIRSRLRTRRAQMKKERGGAGTEALAGRIEELTSLLQSLYFSHKT